MKTVEFLLAYDDRTWDSLVHSVPDDLAEKSNDEIVSWFRKTYLDKGKYPGVVLVGVYSDGEST